MADTEVDPHTCPHDQVFYYETYMGHGKIVKFKCAKCDHPIRPEWKLCDAFGKLVKDGTGS